MVEFSVRRILCKIQPKLQGLMTAHWNSEGTLVHTCRYGYSPVRVENGYGSRSICGCRTLNFYFFTLRDLVADLAEWGREGALDFARDACARRASCE